jgi:tetratricopeptide (TPR) repeat protein
MYLHPWEVLLSGCEEFVQTNNAQYVGVLQGTLLTKEIRIWRKNRGLSFQNPVYEFLINEDSDQSNIFLRSHNRNDYQHNLKLIEKWSIDRPLSPLPVYYRAITHLAMQEYDLFLNAAEHSLFLEPEVSMSSIMLRYYYALIQTFQFGKYKPALQNLNLCIASKPLMAEFWCLLGDIHYHLLGHFQNAEEFYRDAMVLGSRRLANDLYPMDISKYKDYPQTMIKSCLQISKQQSLFTKHN